MIGAITHFDAFNAKQPINMFKNYKKIILLFGTMIICLCGYAQNNKKAVRSLIAAEKQFAHISVTKNTVEAFLASLADSGIVFQKGQPVNGKNVWLQRKPDSSQLSWTPVFADVSSAGDMGYTTGPWSYKVKRTDDKPAAYGEYNTVWIKEPGKDWKVFLDLGAAHPLSSPDGPVGYSQIKSTAANDIGIAVKESSAAENILMTGINTNGEIKILQNFLSAEARLVRPGHFTYAGKDSIARFFENGVTTKYEYTYAGSRVAASGDMIAFYGKIKAIRPQEDGSSKVLAGNYLRIWKKEKENGWKVVLDVADYR